MLKIAKVVKDKKTPEGLDLIGKGAILEHLAKWCERVCSNARIDDTRAEQVRVSRLPLLSEAWTVLIKKRKARH